MSEPSPTTPTEAFVAHYRELCGKHPPDDEEIADALTRWPLNIWLDYFKVGWTARDREAAAEIGRLREAVVAYRDAIRGLTKRTLDGKIYFEASPLHDGPAVLAAWKALDAAGKRARQALQGAPDADS